MVDVRTANQLRDLKELLSFGRDVNFVVPIYRTGKGHFRRNSSQGEREFYR